MQGESCKKATGSYATDSWSCTTGMWWALGWTAVLEPPKLPISLGGGLIPQRQRGLQDHLWQAVPWGRCWGGGQLHAQCIHKQQGPELDSALICQEFVALHWYVMRTGLDCRPRTPPGLPINLEGQSPPHQRRLQDHLCKLVPAGGVGVEDSSTPYAFNTADSKSSIPL